MWDELCNDIKQLIYRELHRDRMKLVQNQYYCLLRWCDTGNILMCTRVVNEIENECSCMYNYRDELYFTRIFCVDLVRHDDIDVDKVPKRYYYSGLSENVGQVL
jgi:hypothetical protein